MIPRRDCRRSPGYKPEPRPKEKDIMEVVDQTLDAYNIFHWRNNTGVAIYRNSKGKRFVKYGKPGSADYLGICHDGRFLAVECKRDAKQKPTELQRDFLDAINRYGGVGIVVSSLDSLLLQLKQAEVI